MQQLHFIAIFILEVPESLESATFAKGFRQCLTHSLKSCLVSSVELFGLISKRKLNPSSELHTSTRTVRSPIRQLTGDLT